MAAPTKGSGRKATGSRPDQAGVIDKDGKGDSEAPAFLQQAVICGMIIPFALMFGSSSRSPLQKQLSVLLHSKHLLLPLAELEWLAQQSFLPECFDELQGELFRRLTSLKPESKPLHKGCLCLVVLLHLVKHGPGAWADVTAEHASLLKGCVSLPLKNFRKESVQQNAEVLARMCKHLLELLEDRDRLREERFNEQSLKARLDLRARQCPEKEHQGKLQMVFGRVVELLWQVDRKLDKLDEWLDARIDELLGITPLRLEDQLVSEI